MLGMDCGVFLMAFVGGVRACSLRYGNDLILSDEFWHGMTKMFY
jgi:hypothetical protein